MYGQLYTQVTVNQNISTKTWLYIHEVSYIEGYLYSLSWEVLLPLVCRRYSFL